MELKIKLLQNELKEARAEAREYAEKYELCQAQYDSLVEIKSYPLTEKTEKEIVEALEKLQCGEKLKLVEKQNAQDLKSDEGKINSKILSTHLLKITTIKNSVLAHKYDDLHEHTL